MVVIAVDDEPISLDCLEVVLSNMSEIDQVLKFSNAEETVSWFKNKDNEKKVKDVKVAFLDIEMWGMNGLSLAAEIRKIQPVCKIIFVTSTPRYALEAFKIHANGYIVKPVTAEAVRKELDYLTMPSDEDEQKSVSEKLRVQCFGNFEVFFKGKNVRFGLSRAKELLAYLVHRKGASCSVSEIASVIFEDRTDSDSLQSQVRNMVSNMKKSLEEVGIDTAKLIIKSRGYIAINPDELNCDYYEFINGNPAAINTYNGEYMSQYSWSEFTIGYLERQLNK